MPPDWAGRAAFVLAFGVSVALTTIVLAAAFSGRQLETSEVTAIATTVGAAVGAVATYLGAQANRPPRDKPDHRKDEDDT